LIVKSRETLDSYNSLAAIIVVPGHKSVADFQVISRLIYGISD